MSFTKKQIREKLETDDKWLIRGVMAIYDKQTADEARAEATKYHNGVGFNAGDGRWGASFAGFARRNGYLTTKQINYIRPKMLKYAGQLAKIANGTI